MSLAFILPIIHLVECLHPDLRGKCEAIRAIINDK